MPSLKPTGPRRAQPPRRLGSSRHAPRTPTHPRNDTSRSTAAETQPGAPRNRSGPSISPRPGLKHLTHSGPGANGRDHRPATRARSAGMPVPSKQSGRQHDSSSPRRSGGPVLAGKWSGENESSHRTRTVGLGPPTPRPSGCPLTMETPSTAGRRAPRQGSPKIRRGAALRLRSRPGRPQVPGGNAVYTRREHCAPGTIGGGTSGYGRRRIRGRQGRNGPRPSRSSDARTTFTFCDRHRLPGQVTARLWNGSAQPLHRTRGA